MDINNQIWKFKSQSNNTNINNEKCKLPNFLQNPKPYFKTQ